jgi:hypothetical protein
MEDTRIFLLLRGGIGRNTRHGMDTSDAKFKYEDMCFRRDTSKVCMPGSHPNYSFYANRLSRGWLFGRKVVSNIRSTGVRITQLQMKYRTTVTPNTVPLEITYHHWQSSLESSSL